MVEANIEDRGEEDVWQILDAIGGGRAGEALDRLSRLLASAEEPVAARLSFFGLLAAYCRQLTAVAGLLRISGLPAGETSYPRFKDKLAPALQKELPGGGKNPLAGLHPFRLHKAYLAASRLPLALASRLPAEVLDTEMQIKGESRDPDVALARLVALLAGTPRRTGRAGS
jgi:DNA polymerase III delta subunit